MDNRQFEKYNNISAEKFNLVGSARLSHDEKLSTKARSYAYDAFMRFCKNKGSVVAAIVIIVLVLFSIIVPFCTPYTVSYFDNTFMSTLPKAKLFENTNFWDGCEYKEENYLNWSYAYWIGEELANAKEGNGGHNVIKNQEYELLDNGLYAYREDSYHKAGCKYIQVSPQTYQQIQEYQNETGNQVIYPTIKIRQRPTDMNFKTNANYYYETVSKGGKPNPVLDENGRVKPVYWTEVAEWLDDDYDSLRIEGQDGFVGQDGKTYYYVYSRYISGGDYEIRVNYYEYYKYIHIVEKQDGITEPYFILGTTGDGADVLTCLANGARFSFIFAICIAAINMIVGAIYGAIEGYFGGVADIVMERISDILAAVPTTIVITLLKYHLREVSAVLILFIAFVATGWIGMASRTRMQFYRYKNQEYVLAARTLGAKDWRIIWKHIFPNALGTLVTSCALVIPSMIFSETSLTYLGIIDLSSSNITSVGTLIAKGQPLLTTAPHVALFPSIFLALLMLSFNLFGNGLRDAFNPSLRGTED